MLPTIEPAIDAFDDVVQAGAQGGERDDQLGGVAEGRVEQAADAFAHALGEMLGGPTHPRRERQDREAGGDEDQSGAPAPSAPARW